jgi:hypothetical protein
MSYYSPEVDMALLAPEENMGAMSPFSSCQSPPSIMYSSPPLHQMAHPYDSPQQRTHLHTTTLQTCHELPVPTAQSVVLSADADASSVVVLLPSFHKHDRWPCDGVRHSAPSAQLRWTTAIKITLSIELCDGSPFKRTTVGEDTTTLPISKLT